MKLSSVLLASLGLSHAWLVVPAPRAHASRVASPRMLFGGGGKEGEVGGLNMMETIKKAQQACAARPWDATPSPPPPHTASGTIHAHRHLRAGRCEG